MKLDIGGVERLATGITPYSFALAGADCTYTVADGEVDVDGISIAARQADGRCHRVSHFASDGTRQSVVISAQTTVCTI